MADVIDQAQDHVEVELSNAIAFARNNQVQSNLSPEGYCHYCFEDIDDPQLFCNSDCANSHDRRQNR